MEDRFLLATVINTNDAGVGSLRAALDATAGIPGGTIDFKIPTTDPGYDPATGTWRITLSSSLTIPAATLGVSNPVVVNGAEASTNKPLIELVGGNFDGLDIIASGATVRGLVIDGFGGNGIVVNGDHNTIVGCYIGTDVTGGQANGNSYDGIQVNGPNNTIGGTTLAARNVISGNGLDGIEIGNQSGPVLNSPNNLIQGNFIGTDKNGTIKLGNSLYGVQIISSSDNTVGGTVAGARNIISGNGSEGIALEDSGTTRTIVQGNLIGTDVTGTKALGNGGDGIGIGFTAGTMNPSSLGNTIGGTTAAAGNIISGNQANGIAIGAPYGGGSGNLILGNFIGTNASGANLGNTGAGVLILHLASNNTIGPANTIGRNGTGIDFESGATANVVLGNFIGTDPTGTVSRGNTLDGILLNNASSNRIIGNVVSGNGIDQDAAGINLESNDSNNIIAGNEIGTAAAGTAALGNSLHGIFLGNGSSNNTIGGLTVNDRNVISGNAKFPVADFATQGGVGVYIYGANTSGNVVQGNYIGTNAAGTAALDNSVIGVLINLSPGNTVQGNLISGNRFIGLEIAGGTASGNLVQGNLIGTNAGGTAAIPNGDDGIFINNAPNNTIGGTAAGAGNLISANLSAGIQIYGAGATNNQVFRNRIGLDANGRLTLRNGVTGIFSQISIQANDFGFSTVNRNLGQALPSQSPSSIGGDPVSGASQAAVAAHRKASRARSVSGHDGPLTKRKTVIVTAVHSYPNAKLALGLSRKSPA
jgi:hypothetical protein